MQNRDAEGLEAVSAPALWSRLTLDDRDRMAALFPREAPREVTVSGYRPAGSGDGDIALVLDYRYPHTTVTASLSLRRLEHGFELTGLDITATAADSPG